MINPENNIVSDNDLHNEQPLPEAAPGAGIDLPAPPVAKQPRNQHLRVDAPKNKQFSARCTEQEHQIISAAMRANGSTDIVQLMLYSIKLHKQDMLTSFNF